MATSSITHSFVINDRKTAEAFIDIISAPVEKKAKPSSLKFRIVTDPNEISSILASRKKSSER